MSSDGAGLDTLSTESALALAATVRVGRIALVTGDAPVVVPVNFGIMAGDIVFRTSSPSKLLAAVSGAIVSFEVDDFDPETRSGWSVLVSGPASELVDDDDIVAANALRIDSWVAPFDRYVRIESRVVTGRRLRRESAGTRDWFSDWDLGQPSG